MVDLIMANNIKEMIFFTKSLIRKLKKNKSAFQNTFVLINYNTKKK